MLSSCLDEVERLEKSKTDAVHKDQEEILYEIDEQLGILDLEKKNERQRDDRAGDASVEVAEQHMAYDKRKLYDAWMRTVLKDAEERDIDEALLGKLIDAVRLSRSRSKLLSLRRSSP